MPPEAAHTHTHTHTHKYTERNRHKSNRITQYSRHENICSASHQFSIVSTVNAEEVLQVHTQERGTIHTVHTSPRNENSRREESAWMQRTPCPHGSATAVALKPFPSVDYFLTSIEPCTAWDCPFPVVAKSVSKNGSPRIFSAAKHDSAEPNALTFRTQTHAPLVTQILIVDGNAVTGWSAGHTVSITDLCWRDLPTFTWNHSVQPNQIISIVRNSVDECSRCDLVTHNKKINSSRVSMTHWSQFTDSHNRDLIWTS